MTDRALLERALPPGTSAPVAHYTRLGTLPLLLPEGGAGGWGSAWATPVQFLNDRRELTLGLEVLRAEADRPPAASRRVKQLLDRLLATLGRPDTDAFQMSFSGNTDDLGQWRGYAANGMGCAVVTDALAVRAAGDVAGWVIYGPGNQRRFARQILEGLRKRTDVLNLEQALVAAACFMKDEGFAPEEEYRLVCVAGTRSVHYRATGDRLVPYVDFLAGGAGLPVLKVIVGPGWQLRQLGSREPARNHVIIGIRRLLEARGLVLVPVEPSSIPFDPR
jgi:hypothetical protein